MSENREGSLEAPTRHPLDWKNPAFYDEAQALAEMERVFEICHGCRRQGAGVQLIVPIWTIAVANEALQRPQPAARSRRIVER